MRVEWTAQGNKAFEFIMTCAQRFYSRDLLRKYFGEEFVTHSSLSAGTYSCSYFSITHGYSSAEAGYWTIRASYLIDISSQSDSELRKLNSEFRVTERFFATLKGKNCYPTKEKHAPTREHKQYAVSRSTICRTKTLDTQF